MANFYVSITENSEKNLSLLLNYFWRSLLDTLQTTYASPAYSIWWERIRMGYSFVLSVLTFFRYRRSRSTWPLGGWWLRPGCSCLWTYPWIAALGGSQELVCGQYPGWICVKCQWKYSQSKHEVCGWAVNKENVITLRAWSTRQERWPRSKWSIRLNNAKEGSETQFLKGKVLAKETEKSDFRRIGSPNRGPSKHLIT